MYKHTGQGLVGYFWNGVLVNCVHMHVCVYVRRGELLVQL